MGIINMQTKSVAKPILSTFATIDCSTGSERASVCGVYATETEACAASRRLGGFVCAVEFEQPVDIKQRAWKSSVVRVLQGELR